MFHVRRPLVAAAAIVWLALTATSAAAMAPGAFEQAPRKAPRQDIVRSPYAQWPVDQAQPRLRRVQYGAIGDERRLTGRVQARDEAVRRRQRPQFQPTGTDLGKVFGEGTGIGSYTLYPSLGSGLLFDDNVFRAPLDQASDIFARIEPTLDFRSDWLNHQADLRLSGQIDRYFEETTNNSEDFFADFDGRYDLANDDALTLTARAGRAHELRSDPNTAPGTENVNEFFIVESLIEGQFRISNLLLEPLFEFTHFDFRDNGAVLNDDRDRVVYRSGGRIGYQARPGFAVFVQGTYEITRYRIETDFDGFRRDSTGYDIRAGTRFEPSGVTYLEATVGYFDIDIDDPRLDDPNGIAVNASLTWNPTDLATVTGSVSREVLETTLADISSIDTTRFGLNLDYEILVPLIASVQGSYQRQDFKDDERLDEIVSGGALLTYFINRNVMMEAQYTHSRRASNDAFSDFVANRASLRLRFQL